MCFVGYSTNSKGYRLMDLSNEKIVTRRYVTFNEVDFRLFSQNNGVSVSSSEVPINYMRKNQLKLS